MSQTPEIPQKTVQKCIAYVDGFNLYHGMRAGDLRRYYWLNVHLLANKLKLPHQVIVQTKYFTSRISGGHFTDTQAKREEREHRRARQSEYLKVLQTVPEIRLIEGKYFPEVFTCARCNNISPIYSEKMTDVNIATEMIMDAMTNEFEAAYLISGDSDLVPPVVKILELFPHKFVNIINPPNRRSFELQTASQRKSRDIENSHLKKSQFPEFVTVGGRQVKRPDKWK